MKDHSDSCCVNQMGPPIVSGPRAKVHSFATSANTARLESWSWCPVCASTLVDAQASHDAIVRMSPIMESRYSSGDRSDPIDNRPFTAMRDQLSGGFGPNELLPERYLHSESTRIWS